MPQLTQRFGPIPQTVVLDGSGNGTVSFQPNGSNARITNLFVKTSTQVLQATCQIYLGTISDTNRINITNSGSTGAAATGNIDVTDGQTVFVVWTGGDAGATATATFVGVTVPFDEIGASVIDWADPIAAGDGSLIYPAVKSPNFVAGSTGWMLDRAGNVEFNSAVIRGSLIAGGGNVVIDSNGVDVHSTPVDTRYRINTTGGFIATRNSGDDGRFAKVTIITSTFGGGIFSGNPSNPLPNGVAISSDGKLSFSGRTVGTTDTPYARIDSPTVTGKVNAAIEVRSQGSNSVSDDSIIIMDAATVNVTDNNLTDSIGHQYLRGENRRFLISFAGLNNTTLAQSFTTSFATAPIVTCNIDSGNSQATRWQIKAINVTSSGFTLFLQYASDGVTTFTWANFPVVWTAQEPTP